MAGEFDERFKAFQALPRQQKAAKIQALPDDQKQAFVQSFNAWKGRAPAGPAMGPEYNPQKLQISRQLTDAENRSKANDITRPEFWNAVVQKASMGLAPKAADMVTDFSKGNFDALAPGLGMPPGMQKPKSHAYQDQYKKDADNSFGGSIAGRIINPTNLIPAGGAVGNAIIAGGQDAVEDAVGGRQVDVGQAVTDAAMAGGLSKVIDIGMSPIQAYNKAIQYLGPKSLDMMHEVATSMLKARGMDPETITKYMNGPSQKGLARRMDDFVDTLINTIKPKGFESTNQRAARTADIVNESGREVGAARQKMDTHSVPAPERSNDLEGVARRAELNPGKYGGFGSQTASIIRNEYNKTPTMIADAMRPTAVVMGEPTSVIPKANIGEAAQLPVFDQQMSKILDPKGNPVPLGKIESIGQDPFAFDSTVNQTAPTEAFELGPEIESTNIPFDQMTAKTRALRGSQFKPSYQMSHPEMAVQQAGKAVDAYGMKKAGYTPEQTLRLQKANADYEDKSHTQQLLANAQEHGPVGFSSNTPSGQAKSEMVSWVKNKYKSLRFAGAQQTAKFALQKLDAKYGTGEYGPRSAFQGDLLRSKLQQIAQMEPRQAAVYSFAESMRDPSFRAILAKAQEDHDNE